MCHIQIDVSGLLSRSPMPNSLSLAIAWSKEAFQSVQFPETWVQPGVWTLKGIKQLHNFLCKYFIK